MRTYLTRKGKFKGEHTIYDTVDEFKKYHPFDNLWRWSIDSFSNYKVGDFIQSEDGYVVPLLSVYELKSKRGTGSTFLFKFPMGTFGTYMKKDGSVKYPCFKAWLSGLHTSSIGGKQAKSSEFGVGTKGQIERKKRRFAMLIGQGMDLRKAYYLIFTPQNYVTPAKAEYKVNELLKDKIVLEELSEFMNPLLQKMQETFTEERIVQELDSLITESKPGTTVKRDNIEFVLKLMMSLEKREQNESAQLPPPEKEIPPLLGSQVKENL